MSPKTDVVLFDPLETIGSETAMGGRRFADFDVYPSARELLERLDSHARLGVFSLDPDVPLGRLQRALFSARLIPPIDPGLVGVAHPEDSAPFATLLAESELTTDQVVFVSLDAGQRTRAISERVRVAPHPDLAAAVLAGQSLHYVRVSARRPVTNREWTLLFDGVPAVPLLRTNGPEPVVYAIAASQALATLSRSALVERRFAIEDLAAPDVVASTMLFLLQITPEQANADPDLQEFVASLAHRDLPLVRETPDGWLIALPGDRSLEDLHPPRAGAGHGHTLALLPDAGFLEVPARAIERASTRNLLDWEKRQLEKLDATLIRKHLQSWFGGIEPR